MPFFLVFFMFHFFCVCELVLLFIASGFIPDFENIVSISDAIGFKSHDTKKECKFSWSFFPSLFFLYTVETCTRCFLLFFLSFCKCVQ